MKKGINFYDAINHTHMDFDLLKRIAETQKNIEQIAIRLNFDYVIKHRLEPHTDESEHKHYCMEVYLYNIDKKNPESPRMVWNSLTDDDNNACVNHEQNYQCSYFDNAKMVSIAFNDLVIA